jgi:hypothetical protein
MEKCPALSDETQGQGITVKATFRSLDGGNDGTNDTKDTEGDDDGDADEDGAEDEAHDEIDKQRDMEIQRLFGMLGHDGIISLLHQVNHKREQKAHSDEQGDMAKYDPKAVFVL